MANLTPGEYRAWEQRRRHTGGARGAVDAVDWDDIGWGDTDAQRRAATETTAALVRVAHTLDPVAKAFTRPGPVRQAPEALEVPEGRGPLSLRIELWWMRRRLAWQLRGLHEPADR